MLSALIQSRLRYPAVHLAAQPVNRRSVHHGPLVRGAKPPRRYELLGGISLLSPEYLLSFERRSFHTRPPDHYIPVSCLLGMSASQSSALMLLHSFRPVTNRPEGTFESLRYSFGGDHPSQTTRQTVSAQSRVRPQTYKGPYFKGGSTNTGVPASLPPAYPTHRMTKVSAKLFRAGRNLPDKEFRYLRTVIVTAAVYRGFNSMLHHKADISS